MALEPTTLSSLVFLDHLTFFPTALSGVRSNPATGVLPHVVSEEFISALCTAVVTALKTLPIMDLGVGTVDLPGIAVPVPVAFPGIPAAQAYLLIRNAWTGPVGSLAASVFIGSVLLGVSKTAQLVMPPHPLMGTGTGVVSPASNPGLEAVALAALLAALPVAFQANGNFGTGDIPGAPANPLVMIQLTGIAEALAKGIATMTATVPYVGNASTPTPIAGALNTGVLV